MRRRDLIAGASAVGALALHARSAVALTSGGIKSVLLRPSHRPRAGLTADQWSAAVTARGGTVSGGTLAAMQELETGLRNCAIYNKMVYFNARAGSDITGAKTPLIAAFGPGFDTVAGTLAAWVETNGLVNSSNGVVDTGIVAKTCGISGASCSLGAYLLNDVGNGNPMLGDLNPSGVPGGFRFTPNNFGFAILDAFGNSTANGDRVQSASSTGGTLTKGLMCGSRWSTTSAAVFRNGAQRGSQSLPAFVGSGIYSDDIKIDTSRGTSGGDFIGLGLTPDDVSNLTWILHLFNTALGRAATFEGSF